MSRSILLVTAGIFHPSIFGRWVLHRTLSQSKDFTFRHVNSLEWLPRLKLRDYCAIVLYIHHKTISDAALACLDHFVGSGGGLLALHSATASFKQSPHYFGILGGRFTGHGPVGTFRVEPILQDNMPAKELPFDGIPGFSIHDELYLHELQPGVRAHFQAMSSGQPVPVVWTYPYGRGKVCYACPGHTAASLRHPLVQSILMKGLAWVSR